MASGLGISDKNQYFEHWFLRILTAQILLCIRWFSLESYQFYGIFKVLVCSFMASATVYVFIYRYSYLIFTKTKPWHQLMKFHIWNTQNIPRTEITLIITCSLVLTTVPADNESQTREVIGYLCFKYEINDLKNWNNKDTTGRKHRLQWLLIKTELSNGYLYNIE